MSNILHVANRPQPAEPEPQQTTVELSDLKGILLHRSMLILGTAVSLVLAALLYGLVTPPLFSSTAQIIIDPRDRQVVSNDVNPSSLSPDGGIAQVESQVSVVQSTGVLLRAIEATDLTNDREFNDPGAIGRLIGIFTGGTSEPGTASALEKKTVKTLDSLRRRLAVKRADKVLVIDVTVTAKSADKAALLANAIADAYLADQADARSHAASQASDDLAARLAEQRRQVEKAENAVELYKLENNMVMTAGRLVSEQELTDLNAQLAAAQSRTATLKAQVEQIKKQRAAGTLPGATAEAVQSAAITQLRSQQAVLEERAADLETRLGPRHPGMMAAKSQLRNVQKLIRLELDRIAASASVDYERAVANERDLSNQVKVLKSQLLSTSQASVRLRELQRDLDAVRSIYTSYLGRVQEIREQVNIDTTNARIITRALPAQRKSWPPLPLLLAGALCGGLGLGTGLALFAEYTSPTLLSGGQVQGAIGVPVLGILPKQPGSKRRRLWPFRKRQAAFPDFAAPAGSPRTDGVINLTLSRIADTKRWHSNPRITTSILLTSRSEDGAERTRITGLLGRMAAGRGSRVLLVDGNMSEEGGADEQGLQDVLAGDCAVNDVVHFRFGRNIAYMGRGRQRAILKESDSRFFARKMLAQAQGLFDLVIIDGGNLPENPKAASLAGIVNEVIFVAELNVTPLTGAAAAAQAAAIMGAPLTGALLVDASAKA